MYLGPGGGTLPALSSSIISSMSLGERSSCKQDERRMRGKQNSALLFIHGLMLDY